VSTRYLLDTNIASYLIRGGNAPLQARVATAEPASLCLSAITEGELRYGLAKKGHATALGQLVHEFLARVEILPWDSSAAQAYGPLRASLELAGTPLGNLDTQIAAHALALGATLITNDHAFSRIPTLTLENWTL
jgi:tRNA(fMet)-specific endonuclease VapC